MHKVTRSLQRSIALLGAISALLFLHPAAGTAAGSIWTIQRTPNRSQDFNELRAIATNSASDAWAVGTFRGPSSSAFKTLIEHFDGTAWRAVQSPNVGTSYPLVRTLKSHRTPAPDMVGGA